MQIETWPSKFFVSGARAGDVFELRFGDYMETIDPIVPAMNDDRVNATKYMTAPDDDPKTSLEFFSGIPGWAERAGENQTGQYSRAAMERPPIPLIQAVPVTRCMHLVKYGFALLGLGACKHT